MSFQFGRPSVYHYRVSLGNVADDLGSLVKEGNPCRIGDLSLAFSRMIM